MLEAQLSQQAKTLLVSPHENRGYGEVFPALACFVDLARFTTISEALAADGSSGTERLVELINRFFTPAIEQAARLGGDVIGFGGDALTLLFADDQLDAACAWARAVMRSIDAMPPVETGAGEFPLQAKIGIGQGSAQTFLVGTATSRRTVTGGTAIDRAVEAEHALTPGQVGLLVDSRPSGPVSGTAGSRGDVRLLELQSGDEPSGSMPLQAVTIGDDAITPFVPDRVVERMTQASAELLDEHRPVTVLFIGVGQQPIHRDPGVARDLSAVIDLVEQRGGSTISVGSGDKGTTVLVAFGAPVAFAEQRTTAVLAAAELADRLQCSVGVTSGLCFAGRLGSANRWNYNLLGDVVNRAARLMQLTESGRALVDEATYDHTDARFRWTDPTTERLKGKDEAVRVAFLTEITDDDDAAGDLPLAGRDIEMAMLTDLLSGIDQRGSSLALVGESGVGKTRLARELADAARGLGVGVSFLGLSQRLTASSYGAWRPVVLSCLDLSDDAGPAELQSALIPVMGDGPMSTMIRDVIFGDPFSSEVVRGLDPSAAAEVVEAALLQLIVGHDRPQLIVADDAHDLDEASARLLERLARSIEDSRAALVAITYPDQPPASWPWSARLDLGELSAAEAAALLRDHRSKQSLALDNDQLREIAERVGGNPQLLRLLADSIGRGEAEELPVDARAVVLGRFDRLRPTTQSTLAMAATLGRHFAAADFLGAFTDAGNRESLDDLVAERLVERISPGLLSFASPILQQVAYEASAHNSRLGFHRSVGLQIERQVERNAAARVEELAHHFGFTDDIDRHRRYFAGAARRFKAAFANDQAMSWFRRAIEVADQSDAAALRFDLGSTMEYTTLRAQAADEFELAAEDRAVAPKALASLALLQVSSESYELACATIDRAVALASELDEAEFGLQTVEWVLERASLLHLHGGQPELAKQAAAEQVAAANLLGDRVRIAAALSNSGSAKSWLGELEEAEAELGRSLEIALDAGALALAAEIETDLAMVAFDSGRVQDCLAKLDTALERSRAVGYRRSEATVLGNIALALITDGSHREAWEPIATSLRLVVELEDAISVAAKMGVIAMLLLEDDKPDAAAGFLIRVIRIGRKVGSPAYRDRAYETLAEAFDSLGDNDRAAECHDQRSRQEHEVSDSEIAALDLELAADRMGLPTGMAEQLNLVDELIEGLG